MRHDTLADVMSSIKNAEKVGKKECVTPSSNLIKEVLKLMQKEKYIGVFEFIDDGKSGKFRVELRNRINDCNVVKPRYSVAMGGFEKWEKRFLPATEFGILIVTTTKGVMTHAQAKKDHVGGKLLAYVY
ncbi:30S ribosomal protein S8 [Candidatus Micrarchaeota archaeon RBG_16_49_10]|nr:30S ribosomal protein S8, small subunit ribosomal protein S8 [uncultured archaeon]OGI15357.1 MAG: 30S ribosomal protein S8 [Candidatus Micrarchaeota archaeon RBG_16_49_10]